MRCDRHLSKSNLHDDMPFDIVRLFLTFGLFMLCSFGLVYHLHPAIPPSDPTVSSPVVYLSPNLLLYYCVFVLSCVSGCLYLLILYFRDCSLTFNVLTILFIKTLFKFRPL